MMDKSAAWEAGFISGVEGMDKEAGVMSFLSKGRAAVNKAGANIAGGLGKRLGTGRLGQAADIVAHQGRQQAAKSKMVARGLDNTAKRVAKAKATGAELTSAVGSQLKQTRNPGQRMAMRTDLASAKKKLMDTAKGGVSAPKPDNVVPMAAASKKPFYKRPAALIGGGMALGAGGTYAAMKNGQGGQA